MAELNVITTHLVDNRPAGDWERAQVERPVDVTALAAGFEAFLGHLQTILAKSETLKLEQFQLDELSVVAEVGPNGDFKLVGGASAAVQGGVRFTLRRRHILATADLVRTFNGTQGSNEPSDNILRASLSTQPVDHGEPVKLEHTNVVRTFETHDPLPVVIV